MCSIQLALAICPFFFFFFRSEREDNWCGNLRYTPVMTCCYRFGLLLQALLLKDQRNIPHVSVLAAWACKLLLFFC